MIKKRLIVLTSILLSLNISTVNAESCDAEDMERLKNLANHIDVSYVLDENYRIENDDGTLSEPLKGIYKVSVANLTDELYLYEPLNSYSYYRKDNDDGIVIIDGVGGGTTKYSVYSPICGFIRNLEIITPKYNYFADEEICQDIDINEVEVCDPWYQGETSYELIESKVEEYIENNNNKDD